MELETKKCSNFNIRQKITEFLVQEDKSDALWFISHREAKQIDRHLRLGWLPDLLVAQASELGSPEALLVEMDAESRQRVRTYALRNNQLAFVFVTVDLPGLNGPLA